MHLHQQLLDGDALQAVTSRKTVEGDLAYLGMLERQEAPQCFQQRCHRPGPQAVQHTFAIATRLHDARALELLQMLRGIGDRHAGQLRQLFDRAFFLGNVFKQRQTMGMAQGPGDVCQGGEVIGGE